MIKVIITLCTVCAIFICFEVFKQHTHYIQKDNILSFLLNCKKGYCYISLLFLIVAYLYSSQNNQIIFYEQLISTALLIFISLIDIEYMVLPNKIVLPLIIVFLIYRTITTGIGVLNNIVGMLIGGSIMFVLILSSIWLFGDGALGGGDMKFNALAGTMVGFPAIFNETMYSFIFVGVAILLLAFFKLIKIGQHTKIPYSPFFTIGTIIILLWY